jgi:hypothetical protein
MNRKGTSIVFPVLLTTLGVAWFLTVKNVDPRINWVSVLGFGVLGLLILTVGGIDKVTLVIGPFLLVCCCLAVARQLGHIDWETVLPVLVIVAGVLMLISHLLPVPYPDWLQKPPPTDNLPRKLTLQDRPQHPPGH